MHMQDNSIPGRSVGYPGSNVKAAWALDCALGNTDIESPDLIVGVGDIIHGEIDDYGNDFRFVERELISLVTVPFLPCVGNHENGQGEGISASNAAYDRQFGPGWQNYLFTISGIAFIVVDTSGAHRRPDGVTDLRNRFLERAFDRAGNMPVVVLTHVPLIAMRDEGALSRSFGFSSWKVMDEAAIKIVENRSRQVIAVLCGHLHLTAARERHGICHIMPSGTAGHPSDFAAFDVFVDHIDVEMHRAPKELIGDASLGNIHGARRHGIDYSDDDHPDHGSYISGNAKERRFRIQMDATKRPDAGAPQEVSAYREESAGVWREAPVPFGKSI